MTRAAVGCGGVGVVSAEEAMGGVGVAGGEETTGGD